MILKDQLKLDNSTETVCVTLMCCHVFHTLCYAGGKYPGTELSVKRWEALNDRVYQSKMYYHIKDLKISHEKA